MIIPKRPTVEKKARESVISYSITETTAFSSGINILLCGATKSGRTQLCSTFPDILYINADHGESTPAMRKVNPKQIYLKKGDEISRIIMQVLFDIENKQGMFEKWQPKTIIYDSLTSICDFMEEECRIYEPESKIGDIRGDGLYQGDYGLINTRTIRILDYAKGLVDYFICICNLKMNLDKIAEAELESPAVPGRKLPTIVPNAFDEIYYTGFDTTKNDYYVSTKKTRRFKYTGTKNNVDDFIYDPSFEKLEKFYKK